MDVMARWGMARIFGVDLLRERAHCYDMADVAGQLELIRDRLRGRGRKYRLSS